MSKYTRKTTDEWTIQGHYGQGWEDLSAYDKRDEARADLKAYRANETAPFRLVKKRVPVSPSVA